MNALMMTVAIAFVVITLLIAKRASQCVAWFSLAAMLAIVAVTVVTNY